MLKKILSSTIIKLVLAVIAGILLGFVVGEGFMNVVVTLKYILGQLIFFMVPLIILAFISSSIRYRNFATKLISGYNYNIALEEDYNALEEVVVVAYGKSGKRAVVGSTANSATVTTKVACAACEDEL